MRLDKEQGSNRKAEISAKKESNEVGIGLFSHLSIYCSYRENMAANTPSKEASDLLSSLALLYREKSALLATEKDT